MTDVPPTEPLTAPSLVGPVIPGAPASGPDPAEFSPDAIPVPPEPDIVGVLGPIIQQQCQQARDEAVTTMRAEFQAALNGLGDQVVQLVDGVRSNIETRQAQIGANQQELANMIRNAGGMDEEAMRVMVMEHVRDFFMTAVRAWAESLIQPDDGFYGAPVPTVTEPEMVPEVPEKGVMGG